MTAFNSVRFKVKPGGDDEFVEAHRKAERNWPGLRRASLIKTGEQSYCIIGEWDDMDSLAAARPHMVATLDTFRHVLEDVGGEVTDPVRAGAAGAEIVRPNRRRGEASSRSTPRRRWRRRRSAGCRRR